MATPKVDSEVLSFGPEGEEWHYNRKTKIYDLSRAEAIKLCIPTTDGPPDTKFEISPSISALVVVDMQNYFLSPKCRNHPLGLAAVAPTLKVIEKCRKEGIQVIWLNWGLTEKDLSVLPASVVRSFSRDWVLGTTPEKRGLGVEMGDGKGRALTAGSWNAEIYGPLKDAVREEDVHCPKNRMSGMWNPQTPIWEFLEGKTDAKIEKVAGEEETAGKGKRIRTLLFTGVNTDQCVLGTLIDAYNAGWDCVLVKDCCATPTPYGKETSERNIAGAYGFITDSESICGSKLS